MALLFADGGATDEEISHGSGIALTDPFSALFWCRPSTVSDADRVILGQASTGFPHQLRTSRSGDGTQLLLVVFTAAGSSSCSSVGGEMAADTWAFVGFSYDSSRADESRIYHGDLTTLASDVSTDNIDSDTFRAASGNLFVGRNGSVPNRPFAGDIAIGMVWPGTLLSLADFQAQQFRPHVTAGCELFTHYGYNGIGTQSDWSGNGNNGTLAGAGGPEVSGHVPLGPPFGFDAEWQGAFHRGRTISSLMLAGVGF